MVTFPIKIELKPDPLWVSLYTLEPSFREPFFAKTVAAYTSFTDHTLKSPAVQHLQIIIAVIVTHREGARERETIVLQQQVHFCALVLQARKSLALLCGSASSKMIEDMCPQIGFLEQWVCSKNDQNGFLENQSVG